MYGLADTYATQVAKYMTDNRYKMESWVESAYTANNPAEAIIDKVAQANKKYYVESGAKAFAEALFTNSDSDFQQYKQILEEADADASTVRKQLTDYFKPLYKEAYLNDDTTTMQQIEDILTDINSYIMLEKPITKYTPKKDFEKWIASLSTGIDEEEDEEEEEDNSVYQWLNQ